jgi:hypothetical protein
MPIEPDTINTPQQDLETLRTILAGTVDSQCPDRSFAHANSTQYCPLREALLWSGRLCLKNGTPFWESENNRIFG